MDKKSAKAHKATHFLHNLDESVFRHPKLILSLILLVTLFFAAQIPGVKMYSDFSDLLPQEHTYIELHNEIKESFGGANVIIVGVEVEQGDIFTNAALEKIHRITMAVDSLPGVNHNLVSSVTHRNSRKVRMTPEGNVNSEAYYDPQGGDMSASQLGLLRADVKADPRVYGPLVSPDMKMALVKAQLNEGQLDYINTFNEIQKMRAQEATDGIRIHVTGQPMLVGWAYQYLDQIIEIFLFTALIMVALLIFYFRKAYGVLVPLAAVIVSSIWGVGIISLFGYNLDPLGLVIPFLISARAMSHGIQIVERYYLELNDHADHHKAARSTFENLFRPGSLGVVSDAIGLLLIAIGSIPLNTKLAHYASLWALCIIVTVLLAVPLLLSILPKPKNIAIRPNFFRSVGFACADLISSRTAAKRALFVGAAFLVCGWYFASQVVIGESEPGSPILYQDHDYNLSSKAVNDSFPGSEELYIVAETDAKGGIKRPEVLAALSDLEAHMMLDPEVGGAKGVPDLIKQVNRLLHNDDPRWMQIPSDPVYVGGLMFTYMMSSPIPGALNEFIDTDERLANLVFYYKDHQGETIRRAIHTAKQWINANADRVDGLDIRLAGGTIGVTAAMNEAAYETNLWVLPLVFLLIFVMVMFFYQSLAAGSMMFMAMLFATTLTYAYMGVTGMGININTVPIIAVGVGVGIDYSIYMMDRIRAEMVALKQIDQAVKRAISTTGLAISFTAITLIAGIVMWVLLSDLRFQADAALLLTVMVVLNAAAAMLLVPSWVLVFKPKFICEAYADEDGVIHG
ncbi:MAG: MMPL family transporter [Gammaproteobacteria bacterium]|uniref:efflux RND transporter permease subunit n=1 Tax=Pseudomaricurvus alcaniphilus TaxID=1166482 RepID=UPI00140A587B|nr:MMPL family transporter [Pseudomaricurvus alcaniphilus]MBR9912786.1 MMPL family transporter [Gammaproteobacteria bacterium]NHN37544.1 MMPL family transporter [Pseudomaricurvus alcaniphilus]